MIKVVFFENDKFISWIEDYFKDNNMLFFRFFNFCIFKSDELMLFEDKVLSVNSRVAKFIKANYGYNKSVLKYIEKNNIRNYKIAEQLFFLKNKGFDIELEKEIDLNEVLLNISLFKYGDFIFKCKISSDDNESTKVFQSVLTGKIIMSRKKEDHIIDYISKELTDYGIELNEYDYLIKETGKNKYEISLENINTGKTIMIKNILLNKDNKVYSIGINNGLIL